MSRWTYPPDVDGDLAAKGCRFAGTLGFALGSPGPTTIPPGEVLVLMSERLSDRAGREHYGDEYYGPSLYWSPPSGYQPTVILCWTSMRPDGFVDILYTVDDGANWTVIAAWIPVAQGAYEWAVPNISADKVHILVRWSAHWGEAPFAWAAGPAFKVSYTAYWPSSSLNLRPLFFEPPAPTGLLANGLGPRPQIRLFWEDDSGTEAGFVIARHTGSGPCTTFRGGPRASWLWPTSTLGPSRRS